MIQAGIMSLYGQDPPVRLKQADLAIWDRGIWELYLDMKVLACLIEAMPDFSVRRRKIVWGLNEVVNLWHDGQGINACRTITRNLLNTPASASALTAYSTGHAHLDLAWLWPIRETKRKAAVTFSNAIRMIDEYPEYRFGASQPQLYEWVKQLYPVLYDRIRQAVRTGRWECQGIMWVEPDVNIIGGESIVRQCIYGRKFFMNEFGVEPRNCFLPDVFGFCAQLPQILKLCGADYFVTQKLSWNETTKFPFNSFYWEGLDGSRVLAHIPPSGDYHDVNTPLTLTKAEREYEEAEIANCFLNLYGIGDGGGGPSRTHIEYGLRMADCEGLPRVKYAFVQSFFEHMESICADRLPVWKGELYLELHRGVYTTQARMKKYNRRLERLLHDVEFLFAVAGDDYPHKELEQIWKGVLLNQFHDILPGTSIKWVYDTAFAESESYLARLSALKNNALNRIMPCCDGTGRVEAVAILNTLDKPRKTIVGLPLNWLDGRTITQSSASTVCDDKLFIEIDLPAMGYRILELTAGSLNESYCTTRDNVLENDLIRYEFDENGTIASAFDKEVEREVLAGKGNRLLLWEDRPNNWDAWDINRFYRETMPEQAELIERRVKWCNCLETCIEHKFRVGESDLVQQVRLNRYSKAVLFMTWVDWRESHRMLRASFDTGIRSLYASFEIPFGIVKRPTHDNTIHDHVQFECCAQRFIDLSEPDYGAAILNDCKYGHHVHGGVMEITLLRSPKHPDDSADMCRHTFNYAFLPHTGDLARSGVFHAACELNQPVIIQPLREVPEIRGRSCFSVEHPSVCLDTVKQTEDGSATILRLYEMNGTHAKAVLKSDRPWTECYLADLVERPLKKLDGTGNHINITLEPFQIITLRCNM